MTSGVRRGFTRLADRLATASAEFGCCDTRFTVEVRGPGAGRAVAHAETTARQLESRLDAFDPDSAVARLNETGRVDDEHVARVVRRGLAYRDRTGGAFGVTRGGLEHDLKRYIHEEADDPPDPGQLDATAGAVTVDETTVEAERPVDLNGLAKGYIVDRARAAADGFARSAFVSGGGDMTAPPGVVAIESPWGGDPLKHLDTDWAVATSAGYRRERDGLDHVYDPQTGAIGSRHDLVTALAARDCMEADALATALAALPPGDALSLAEGWDGAEALVVHEGVFRRTSGFENHVAAT
ncbi:MAG: FAD:protein FMN transferase [Haloarculaceae archaeon]